MRAGHTQKRCGGKQTRGAHIPLWTASTSDFWHCAILPLASEAFKAAVSNSLSEPRALLSLSSVSFCLAASSACAATSSFTCASRSALACAVAPPVRGGVCQMRCGGGWCARLRRAAAQQGWMVCGSWFSCLRRRGPHCTHLSRGLLDAVVDEVAEVCHVRLGRDTQLLAVRAGLEHAAYTDAWRRHNHVSSDS